LRSIHSSKEYPSPKNYFGIPILSTQTELALRTLSQWQCFFINDKRFNNVWVSNFGSGLNNFINSIKWILKALNNKYDLIIDFQTNDRSRIFLSILRIFFQYPKLSIGNHFVFPYTIKIKNNIKINQPFFRLKRTIGALNILPSRNDPKIIVPKKSEYTINDLLKKSNLMNKKFVIFIPGSSKSNKLKRWGHKKFIQLSILLDNDFKIILVGGPDDINECKKISNSNSKIYNFCNKINLIDLIPFFKKANYIIANDTGPTHLTACSNTKVIQITGPTNPYKVKPFGENIISIQPDLECKNCYQKVCTHHSCMQSISPEYIHNLIMKI